jgi:hypothetical protein
LATSSNFTFNGTNVVLGGTTGVSLGGDVVINRGAANRLDVASGDSLRIVSGNLELNTDVSLTRGAANRLDLASGDTFNIVSGALQVAATDVITSGRLLQAATGTALLPAFTFSADTNTGIYTPAADTLAFTVGGTEQARLSSTGLGLGTTTPSSRLTIAGDAFITGALRDSSNASGTSGMVLTSTGSGTQWLATSSLGISGVSTFLGLTDTPSNFSINGAIPYESSDTLAFSSNFTYDGTLLRSTNGMLGAYFGSTAADIADAGAIRLGNAELIAWEASPAGTDVSLSVNASEQLVFTGGGAFIPATNDGASLGVSGTAFADLFLASGGVLNFDAGDLTLTDTGTNILTLAGGNFAVGANFINNDGGTEGLSFGTLGETTVTTAATTNNAFNITADSLTTGSAARIVSNSANTSARSILNIINDNAAASGAVALRIQQDSTADIVNIFDGATEVFTILDGGNVGIGTSTPGGRLTVAGGGVIANAPTSPTLTGTFDTSGIARAVTVAGRYAYVADGTSGLQIIDISNPASPALVGTFDTSGDASDVTVVGRYAYVADDTSGIQIIDISNPASPALVGTFDTSFDEDNAYAVTVAGRYAYVAYFDNALEIIDISNPTNPVPTGTLFSSFFASDVTVAGRYAYVAHGETGFQIVDISNPTNPTLTGEFDNGSIEFASGVDVVDRYAYVAYGLSGLQIIDISNPATPTSTSIFNTTGSANDVIVAGHYAYVADGTSGLQMIDISNPVTPTLTGTFNTSGSAIGVTVAGRYAYVADGASGLQIIDINGSEFSSLFAGALGATEANIVNDLLIGNTLTAGGALNVGHDALIGGALTIRGTASSSLLANNSNPALIVQSGNVGLGTTTPSSRLTLTASGTGTSTLGLFQYLTSTNSSAGALQKGSDLSVFVTGAATTSIIGQSIFMTDSTTLGNTVRGLEIQADRGSNTQGENTGLSAFGNTFGVRGVTTGEAGGFFEPAGGYFETEGTTQGNAIRGYSNSITTASLLSLFQEGSAFTGTGLLMNFGNNGGSFSSTTSRYIDLKNSNTSVFTVSAFGTTTIGNGTDVAGLQIGRGGLCVDDDGSCAAGVAGRVAATDYFTGNSDVAETYFSSQSLEPGDVIALVDGLTIARATTDTATRILGVVSTAPGILLGSDDAAPEANQTAYPIALSGRVPVRLSTENGPIRAGDALMLSSLPGVAMKATGTGMIIGTALDDFDGTQAYSETYVNQFGENIIVPEYVPITSATDPRLSDGCYYSGGGRADEEPCVPLTATTTEGRITEADVLAAEEAKERALRQLARQQSELRTLEDGTTVQVGQVTMFVERRWRYLDEAGERALFAVMRADTSGLAERLGIEGDNADGSFVATVIRTLTELWDRVVGHDARLTELEMENALLQSRLERVEAALNATREASEQTEESSAAEPETEVETPELTPSESPNEPVEDSSTTTLPVDEAAAAMDEGEMVNNVASTPEDEIEVVDSAPSADEPEVASVVDDSKMDATAEPPTAATEPADIPASEASENPAS